MFIKLQQSWPYFSVQLKALVKQKQCAMKEAKQKLQGRHTSCKIAAKNKFAVGDLVGYVYFTSSNILLINVCSKSKLISVIDLDLVGYSLEDNHLPVKMFLLKRIRCGSAIANQNPRLTSKCIDCAVLRQLAVDSNVNKRVVALTRFYRFAHGLCIIYAYARCMQQL